MGDTHSCKEEEFDEDLGEWKQIAREDDGDQRELIGKVYPYFEGTALSFTIA